MHQHATQLDRNDYAGQVHLNITAPVYAHVIPEFRPYFEKLVPDGPSLTPYQEKVNYCYPVTHSKKRENVSILFFSSVLC
jgi:hypothetical protein